MVGDTFPVGCRFSVRMAHREYVAVNPDAQDPRYLTACGIPAPGCGLGAVQRPWVKPCRENLLARSLPTTWRL